MWSYTAGSYGNTVKVSERTEGGYIYARWTENGVRHTKSLRLRSKTRARNYAHSLSDRLAGGAGSGSARVSAILSEYLKQHSPKKSSREVSADAARCLRFGAVWGMKQPNEITRLDWDRFDKQRRAEGAGDRAVEADFKWFNSVLNWATKWATDKGYLLDENPVRGFPIPHNKNPKQPVMTQEVFDHFEENAHEDMRDLMWIANETGRRLGAIIGLHWHDVSFIKNTIVWSEDTDKTGKRSEVPLSDACRRVLVQRADRLGITQYVFPSPRDHNRPMHRNRAQAWAEALSKKIKQPWPGWHSIRRKWVSERPATQAVAQAGGWANLRTMLMCYNKPDMEAMREAVEQRTPYREAR